MLKGGKGCETEMGSRKVENCWKYRLLKAETLVSTLKLNRAGLTIAVKSEKTVSHVISKNHLSYLGFADLQNLCWAELLTPKGRKGRSLERLVTHPPTPPPHTTPALLKGKFGKQECKQSLCEMSKNGLFFLKKLCY